MIPLWQRIANLLRARLSPLPPGTPLPGETALAAEFGAARMTLRRALAMLEAEGLIRREAGRGSFVARPGNAEGLIADMREIGAHSAVRLLALDQAPLPVHAAAALDLDAGAPALHIRRVRADAAGAFSLVDSFVPLSAARSLPRARIARGTPI
ncbi:MAG: GntR family transcriptional regulator, partial [Alphaproteobacteria bacterium]|nr:GntR family transcriptional regulator [Alphaproteobacteria bacterium]